MSANVRLTRVRRVNGVLILPVPPLSWRQCFVCRPLNVPPGTLIRWYLTVIGDTRPFDRLVITLILFGSMLLALDPLLSLFATFTLCVSGLLHGVLHSSGCCNAFANVRLPRHRR